MLYVHLHILLCSICLPSHFESLVNQRYLMFALSVIQDARKLFDRRTALAQCERSAQQGRRLHAAINTFKIWILAIFCVFLKAMYTYTQYKARISDRVASLERVTGLCSPHALALSASNLGFCGTLALTMLIWIHWFVFSVAFSHYFQSLRWTWRLLRIWSVYTLITPLIAQNNISETSIIGSLLILVRRRK